MALFKRRDRVEARRLRRRLVDHHGQETFDAAVDIVVDCWRETGDIGMAEKLLRRTLDARKKELGSIATVVAFIELAFLIFKFLKWMGWLSPSPDQLQSLYAEEDES